jgi:allophanate hydrolase subunit 2
MWFDLCDVASFFLKTKIGRAKNAPLDDEDELIIKKEQRTSKI